MVVFNDGGTVRDVIHMGPYGSGKAFYYRIMEPCYHSVLVNTPFVFFHETTNGPFDRSETEFAGWSPEESDAGVSEYVAKLRGVIPAQQRAA